MRFSCLQGVDELNRDNLLEQERVKVQSFLLHINLHVSRQQYLAPEINSDSRSLMGMGKTSDTQGDATEPLLVYSLE